MLGSARKTSTLLLVAALTACGGIDAPIDPVTGVHVLYPEGAPEAAAVTGAVRSKGFGLVQLDGCDGVLELLRSHLIGEAIQRAQSAYASAVDDYERCGEEHYFDGGVVWDAAAMAPSGGDPEGGEGPEHSETNNQVQGVDEADIVKTDGEHIYTLNGGALLVLKAWPAAQTRELARVAIEGAPKKLFVLGDRLLVYSSIGGPSGGYPSSGEDCTYGYDCVPSGDGQPTKISVFDIADRGAPRLVRELQISSSLLAARRIGRAVHSVVTLAGSNAALPHLRSWPDGLDVCDASPRRIYDAFREQLLRNLETLHQLPLSAVLPTLRDRVHGADGTVTENPSPLASCGGFFRTSIRDGQRFTSVLSLTIDDEQPASAATIISPPGVVYASQDSLYLGVRQVPGERWGWYEGVGDHEVTTIHKFRLDNAGARARYAASGLIKGRLLNQFAIDEHRGALRLAATTGHWGAALHNTLTVLEQQGRDLQPVGVLDRLAPTEDIRAVRFAGDKGYVVTFKQTDPLFVIDLSQPTRPQVLGELKIPGFSTYMHQLDETHLLTIGYDGDDEGNFAWFTGVQLQVFDVSEPSDPKLRFKHVIGTRGASSEALTNHLAFTYYAPKNLLALPMTVCEGSAGGGTYGENMTFSGLMVFDVTAEEGFALKGQVPFPQREEVTCHNWWTHSTSQVKRSLIIGDFIYSMSDALLKVNALEDLGRDLAAVPLE